MPAEQHGQPYKTRKGWGLRWYDEAGRRRRRSGFETRSAALAWYRDIERPRLRGEAPQPLTLREFSDRYLERYEALRSPVTVATLRARLVRPLAEFGDVSLGDLRTGEIAALEATLPPRFRYAVVRALRQVLDAAVAWDYLARNPAKATGRNPAPPVLERAALETADVDRLAAEMRPPYDATAIVGAWCYLRPSELLALERGDVDQTAGVLHVRRTLDSEGGTKPAGKTRRSLRTVPLPSRAARALAELPPRLDTRLLFPAPGGRRLRPAEPPPPRVRVGA
jgi:integrase